MRNNKAFKRLITFSAAAAMTLSLAACGGSAAPASSSKAVGSAATSAAASSAATSQASSVAASSTATAGSSAAASQGVALDLDMKTILEQVANTKEKVYKDLFKATEDQVFASAEVFGLDRTGDTGKMYVFAAVGEYISLKGKAYFVSGMQGEAIFNIEYSNGGANLKSIDWSEDGAGHNKWVKDNFPKAYYEKATAYHPSEDNGKGALMKAIDAEAEKMMGVPVEQKYLINIDMDAKTYEIFDTKESGSGANYKFETITVEKGKL